MNEDVHESVASKRAVDLMRPGLIDDFIAFGPGRRVVGVREGEICDDLKAECDKAQRENRRSRAGRDGRKRLRLPPNQRKEGVIAMWRKNVWHIPREPGSCL